MANLNWITDSMPTHGHPVLVAYQGFTRFGWYYEKYGIWQLDGMEFEPIDSVEIIAWTEHPMVQANLYEMNEED